ncbi:hypothetical protein [Marinifilum flexuosum]|nr:hypothetical protein [Marinifilum flexuosum]
MNSTIANEYNKEEQIQKYQFKMEIAEVLNKIFYKKDDSYLLSDKSI